MTTKMMKSSIAAVLAITTLSGCAMGLVRIPGKIYSVADGTVLSVEFVPSAMGGHGDIRGDNFKTKEHFEGTFAAVGQGVESVGVGTGLGTVYSHNGASASAFASGISSQSVESSTLNTAAVLIGNLGTILDCNILVQRGLSPRGTGDCTDNAGKSYRFIF